jgi:hypothetical protein
MAKDMSILSDRRVDMREILFRGQHAQNKEWVYGCFFTDTYNNPKIISGDRTCHVIPETVGEYTGIKDKNGVRIFEGDILVVEGTVGEVYMEDCRYSVGHNKGSATFPLGSCLWRDFNIRSGPKIIGNIHDNPELLVRE